MLDVKGFSLSEAVFIGGDKMTLIAGPCSIEGWDMCDEVAGQIKRLCDELDINYVFKGSFDKANRSNLHAGRGVGMDKGLQILQDIKSKYGVCVTTDVHETWQCGETADVCDILQIPAYLCRQTDLILSAAKTGRAVNIKKGQFMAPWNMDNVIEKMKYCENEKIILCERGTTFGYNRLVVDMQGLLDMRKLGYPVFLDATHSVQQPGSDREFTSGNREFAPYLMNAGLAVGVDGIFAEVHPDPDHAVSDGPSQIRLSDFGNIIKTAVKYDRLTRSI
ncbi:MAG: 3-deoxy-8-phosphooctulonate synthase [Lachnospiraceae bacterium]|nr:3-deoxy-8-phosphooctulonate synthase [Lachnospiraceae bacterium]